jgi:hypothetical protein
VLEVIDNSDGDGSFSLNWQSVSDDAMYVLQEADESMCPVTMYFGPETSKQMPWKEIGTYYYRVSALDTGGWSGWSQIQSVEVTVPPPSCDLICSASPDREIRPYDPNHYPSAEVEITCESGSSSQLTSTYQDLISEIKDAEIYGTYFEAKRTYEDSGNTYRIAGYVGQDWVDNAWRVRYHIEVTGGVFGESPRTCGTD